MKNQISYSRELRERAVRLVFEQQKEHGSQWSAIKSIAPKIGCTPFQLILVVCKPGRGLCQ